MLCITSEAFYLAGITKLQGFRVKVIFSMLAGQEITICKP
jgi:hypothetical protein